MWNEAVSELQKMILSMQNQLSQAKNMLELFGEPQKNEKIVVYASTKDKYNDMEGAAKSLLEHTPVDKVYFLVEDEEYISPMPDIIQPVNVSNQTWFYDKGPNYENGWTWMTLMRSALHRLFPQYEQMLWLDTDTIVIKDISDLFNMPLSGYYYAAVREPDVFAEQLLLNKRKDTDGYTPRGPSKVIESHYYNVGVLLCNLKALRNGTGDDIIDLINREFFQYKEQDVINLICNGRILELPTSYNSAPFTQHLDNPKILHVSYSIDEQKRNFRKMYNEMDWAWVKRRMEARNG